MPFRIQDLPVHERPRERLLERGVNALADRELLAIILRTGTEGKSALDLAEELIVTFGGWQGLAERSPQELMQVRGISQAKAVELAAIFGIYRRLQKKNTRQRERITGPADVHRLYASHFHGLRQEVLIVVNLSARNHVMSDTQLFVGSLTQSVVHPREVFRIAINESAASILLMHNHPSGDPTPSSADVEITKRFIQAGRMIGIELFDHVIIGSERWWSIKDGRGSYDDAKQV